MATVQRAQTFQYKDVAAAGQVKEFRTVILEKALPPVLQLIFLLYPFVNTVAFEGFPCYYFESGRGWLRADVSIECNTPDHWKWFSWLAVFIYPIGMWFITLALLLLSVRNPHSPLARACSFIFQEYDDACFWWELSTRHSLAPLLRLLTVPQHAYWRSHMCRSVALEQWKWGGSCC